MKTSDLALKRLIREVPHRIGVSQAYVCLAQASCTRLAQTSPSAQCNHMPLRLAAREGALRE